MIADGGEHKTPFALAVSLNRLRHGWAGDKRVNLMLNACNPL